MKIWPTKHLNIGDLNFKSPKIMDHFFHKLSLDLLDTAAQYQQLGNEKGPLVV